MTAFTILIIIFWVIFMLFWLISGTMAKKGVSEQNVRSFRLRLLFFIIFFVLVQVAVRIPGLYAFASAFKPFFSNVIIQTIGTIFCGAGIALAIWARVYLGRNWGMPMTLKEKPELVTSGPYRYVRHPIYSGVLLATFGSTLIIGLLWLVIFLFGVSYFIYSAKIEEGIMLRQFPNEYPEYMKRTNMLAPAWSVIVIILVLVAGVGCYFHSGNQGAHQGQTPSGTSTATPVACTMEAKECPDGSYVGRSGPNCDFAACPN